MNENTDEMKYVLICEISEPEWDFDNLAFYMKTLENAKKAKELLEGIDYESYWGRIDELFDTEDIENTISELIDLGVSFTRVEDSYFVPHVLKVSILENKPISK